MWSGSFSLHFLHGCHPQKASLMMSIFLTFEARKGCWDILFNPLETITAFHFFGNMRLIKCQNLGVGLDLLLAVSNGDSSEVCHSLFSRRCCHCLCSSQHQLPTSDNSFGSVQSFMGICSAFSQVETFHLDVFSLTLAVYIDKQVSISCFLCFFE